MTKRRRALKERSHCECCLVSCKDKEAGTRCYQRSGFRRHRLLRLAVEQEVVRANRAGRKGDQSRNRAAERDRQLNDAPPEKVRWLSSEGELVWLRATNNRHVPATRITHQAVMRLGLPQSVAEAYQVQLRRGSGRPEHMLRAEGVETLECVKPRAERRWGRCRGWCPGSGHWPGRLNAVNPSESRDGRARNT